MACRGSPPRLRGKVARRRDHPPPVGITPAYAGKSRRWCHHRRTAWDHPRVCGEKRAAAAACAQRSGSPPRMRGKVRLLVVASVSRGITPAHAGKRMICPIMRWMAGDHPRACGEKSQVCFSERFGGGSPPRMRGKELTPDYRGVWDRITPAHAGKSGNAGKKNVPSRDHPRACGEKKLSMQRIG